MTEHRGCSSGTNKVGEGPIEGGMWRIALWAVIMVSECACAQSSQLSMCTDSEFSEYKPIVGNVLARSLDERYQVDTKKLSETHLKNFQQVLDYYGQEWKIVNGRLLIRCELWQDKDTLMNFTSKADDVAWLASHSKK